MLGIISAAGNALRAFGSVHPAIKWGVVAIVGLLAVEFIGREGIALYRDMSTTPAQVEQARAGEVEAQNKLILEHLRSLPFDVVRQMENDRITLRDKTLVKKLATAPADVRACYDALKAATPTDDLMLKADDREKQEAQADCRAKLFAFRDAS
jgi:hypothetical protein